MCFRTRPQVCLFPTSVREKSKHLRAQWMLLAPRPPLSRTKAVCPPPFDKLRSYHYWHRSQIRVELRPSQRNCSAKESVFFFSSFLPLSALFSGETPVILPVMTPVEDRSIIYISERGKNPKVEEWRDGGRRRTHRSLHGCCRLRRWSGISSGIRCLLFFFSQA